MSIDFSSTRPAFPQAFSFDGETVRFQPLASYTWSAKIKIHEYGDHIPTLYGMPGEPFETSVQIGKRSVSLLKSNLQKCTRRQDEGRAIRTALAMYSYDPNEVLRRLPIIQIEDCLPNPDGLLRLVWWMCAVSKGYVMSKEEVESMLGILATMCESPSYEVFDSRCRAKTVLDWSSHPEASFFWALEIRKIYGGMECDKKMLSYHQELWMERFKQRDQWNLEQDRYQVDIDSVDPLSKDDILLESIDYHCFTWIPQKIADKYPNLTLDVIKTCIWMCRSRTNLRKPLNQEVFQPISTAMEQNYHGFAEDLQGLTQWLRGKLNLKD